MVVRIKFIVMKIYRIMIKLCRVDCKYSLVRACVVRLEFGLLPIVNVFRYNLMVFTEDRCVLLIT